MTRRSVLYLAIAIMAIAGPLLPSAAWAAGYPDKPIRLIVPFPPGGTADIIGRLVVEGMAAQLGVPVVVDNRAGGAGGSVGTLEIMRAKPDGYTLGIATVGTLGTAPAVAKHPLYDPDKDFSYVANLGQTPMLMAVGPTVTAHDLPAFIGQLKRDPPGGMAFATGGSGGVAHLMGIKFEQATGTTMNHVPYRGASPAINDVIAGQLGIVFDALTSSTPFISGGRLRVLAVSGAQRTASLPDVPTFAELGLPDVSTEAWYGLIAPAGLPADVLDKLNAAVRKTLADPQVIARFRKLDTEVLGTRPAQFRQQVIEEVARWRKLAAAQHIVVE